MAEKKTFNEKEVKDLLQKQLAEASERMVHDSLTSYTAKRLILETPLVL